MKKYIVLFIIVIIAVCSIGYLYLNYKTNANNVQATNKEYSSLYSQIINGATLATNINKIIIAQPIKKNDDILISISAFFSLSKHVANETKKKKYTQYSKYNCAN